MERMRAHAPPEGRVLPKGTSARTASPRVRARAACFRAGSGSLADAQRVDRAHAPEDALAVPVVRTLEALVVDVAGALVRAGRGAATGGGRRARVGRKDVDRL